MEAPKHDRQSNFVDPYDLNTLFLVTAAQSTVLQKQKQLKTPVSKVVYIHTHIKICIQMYGCMYEKIGRLVVRREIEKHNNNNKTR